MSFARQLDLEELTPKYRAFTYAYLASTLVMLTLVVAQAYGHKSGLMLAFEAPYIIFSGIYARWARRRGLNVSRRLRSVHVRVDDRELVVDGRALRLADLKSATTERLDDGRVRVALSRARRLPTKLVGDKETTDALLDAIGFPGGTAATLSAFRASLTGFLIAVSLPLLALFGGALLFGISVPLVMTTGLVALTLSLSGLFFASRRHVRIGSDGVVIESAFGRRYVRLDEIGHVERAMTGVTLVLQNGERVAALPPATLQRDMPFYLEEAKTVASQIEAAKEKQAERARMRKAADVARVARGSRSVSEWVAALRALGAGATSYREGAASPDVLAALVEDPDANADVRVGAAVALRVSGDVAGEQRIRVAAAATAQNDLRIALEGVLEDEEPLEERVAKMRALQ